MKHGIVRSLTLGFVLFAACQQPNKQDTPANPEADIPPPVAGPWTEAFLKAAVLFADDVSIEGPQGMIKHAGLRIEPEIHDSSTLTTKDGLLQEVRLKPGSEGEVRAILDHWEVVAFRRITILERVGPCDVKVLARGGARFVDLETKQESNGDTLQFEGKIPR
jgi:hypothetical protein